LLLGDAEFHVLAAYRDLGSFGASMVADSILQMLLGVSLIIFIAGSLLETGLKLKPKDALGAIRNLKFLFLGVLLAFVLCPAVAVLLTKIVPLPEPYALGMIVLGMTPCAPFFPAMAEKAGGDLAYVAAFMLLATLGTVIFMPLAMTLLVQEVKADAWTIAKPLVLYIIAPLTVGVAIRSRMGRVADRAHPVVKRVTIIDTLIMLALVLWIYGAELLRAVGTYAIGTQLLFYTIVAAASYGSAFQLPHSQRSVLTLGISTRNIGAAFAPLSAVSGTDQRAIAMVALAVPLTVLYAALIARGLAHLSTTDGEAG
jgi:BASS family bile acid:Na+ symporter